MRTFEILRMAIQTWEQTPRAVPSDDLIDRILATASDDGALPINSRKSFAHRHFRLVGIAASAAAIFLAYAVHPRGDRPPTVSEPGESAPSLVQIKPRQSSPRVDLPTLNRAIADASDATWELAYAASAPAVRIGRQVFEPTTSLASDSRKSGPAQDVPTDEVELFDANAPGEVVSETLNQFGEGISEGVRPISNSARRALDFLRTAVPSSDSGPSPSEIQEGTAR
jgi:hypothetical protein